MNLKEHKEKAISSGISLGFMVPGLIMILLGNVRVNGLILSCIVIGMLGHFVALKRSLGELDISFQIQSGNSRYGGVLLLKLFFWFCGKENREIVQIALADLKRDKREMKCEGRGFWFVKAVILWRTLATIIPIIWDGSVRIVKAILPFAKYFKG